ncbi:MAG: hypothetical protein KGZ37_07870 [Nitrosarchaeum sp.]|nr:hypothetical protein [Nitrosarchaeum sp.]
METVESETKISQLLKLKPFQVIQEEKNRIFADAMQEALIYHYNNSIEFRKICQNQKFDLGKKYQLEEIPYLPVSIFKKFELISIPKENIFKTIFSSATTSNTPSKIFLDRITSECQTKALVSIMSDFLNEKLDFLILDTKEIVSSSDEVKSRASAIRGFLPFMKSIKFVLNKELTINNLELQQINSLNQYCIFGFTWLIYKIIKENKENQEVKNNLLKLKSPYILHLGGWKRLSELNISRSEFYQEICEFFNTEKSNIIDIYGMTEQLGTIYPDCEFGNKHVPIYSEIIIRNPLTLENEEKGKSGLIQLISPIPHSYPGISILSDDFGHLEGIDDCPCGRKGKYFRFDKRSESADLKGCGDTIG